MEFEIKDIGMMHNFLGLEVWQRTCDIFLGKGKYAIHILRIFGMVYCMPIATPIITNLKKLNASKSDLVDPTLYRKLIGSLMYLVNTQIDICSVVNTLNQYTVELRRVQWIVAKHVLKNI